MWTFVSIRLLPFNYQCVSRGVKCHPSDPPVSLSSAVLLLYCWVEAGMSATTSETGGGGEVTRGGQACGCACLCMCGAVWGVLLPADLVIHQTGSIHPPHPSYTPPPAPPPPPRPPHPPPPPRPGNPPSIFIFGGPMKSPPPPPPWAHQHDSLPGLESPH